MGDQRAPWGRCCPSKKHVLGSRGLPGLPCLAGTGASGPGPAGNTGKAAASPFGATGSRAPSEARRRPATSHWLAMCTCEERGTLRLGWAPPHISNHRCCWWTGAPRQRRFVPGAKPGWWAANLLRHLCDSMLLVSKNLMLPTTLGVREQKQLHHPHIPARVVPLWGYSWW